MEEFTSFIKEEVEKWERIQKRKSSPKTPEEVKVDEKKAEHRQRFLKEVESQDKSVDPMKMKKRAHREHFIKQENLNQGEIIIEGSGSVLDSKKHSQRKRFLDQVEKEDKFSQDLESKKISHRTRFIEENIGVEELLEEHKKKHRKQFVEELKFPQKQASLNDPSNDSKRTGSAPEVDDLAKSKAETLSNPKDTIGISNKQSIHTREVDPIQSVSPLKANEKAQGPNVTPSKEKHGNIENEPSMKKPSSTEKQAHKNEELIGGKEDKENPIISHDSDLEIHVNVIEAKDLIAKDKVVSCKFILLY